MAQSKLDLSSFEHLDDLVDSLLKTETSPDLEQGLRQLLLEAELVVACVDRIDEWILLLEKGDNNLIVPEIWTRERRDQIRELYTGCDELIEVATQIIPSHLLSLVKPHLN